jgi:transcriptional regulator with XRE-family HTH domain
MLFQARNGNELYMTPLAAEIQRHLTRLGWSQNRLAEVARVGNGTISRLLRGTHETSPATIEAVARALGVDPTHLLELAGFPVTMGSYDPEVAYIARKITELPHGVRKTAIDIIGTQLDSIYELTGHAPSPPESQETHQPNLPPAEEIRERINSGDMDIQQLRQDLFLALKILSQEAPDVFLDIMDEFERGEGDESAD